MKQTCDFERFDPPVLNEQMLRRELERRERRRQTVLLAAAGALLEALLVLLGLLCWDAAPVLTVGFICFAAVSTAGSGAIAIVFTQKGGAPCEPVC